MKRIIALLVAILFSFLLCFSACAESINLSEYSDEALFALLASVQQEVQKRMEEKLPSPASDFIYASNGKEVRINNYIGSSTDVVIPDEIDGVPVTRIFEEAFWGKAVLSVFIPDTITEIGKTAFAWTRVNDIYIGDGTVLDLPRSLKTVGSQAFSSNGYQGVIINSDVCLDFYAFEGMNHLEFLYIREGCNPYLGFLNFRSCRNLEIAIIPASVTVIGDEVFQGCNNLRIITPAGSYAESWAKDNFFPVDTEHYEDYVAEYEALYPQHS